MHKGPNYFSLFFRSILTIERVCKDFRKAVLMLLVDIRVFAMMYLFN